MQRGMRTARYEHVLVKHGKEQELPIDPTTEPLHTPVDQTALLGGVPDSMRRGRRLEFRSRTPGITARKLLTDLDRHRR